MALNFEIDFAFGVGDPALAGDGTLDLLTAPVELAGVCMALSSSFTNDPKVELAADGLPCRCLFDLGVLGALSLPRFTEVRPSIGIVGGRSEPDGVRSTPIGFFASSSEMRFSNSVVNGYGCGKSGAPPAPAECGLSPCGTNQCNASSTKLASDSGVAVRELATAPGIGPDDEDAVSEEVPDIVMTSRVRCGKELRLLT